MVTLLDVAHDNMYGHVNLLAIWMAEPPLEFFKPNENFKNTPHSPSGWMEVIFLEVFF